MLPCRVVQNRQEVVNAPGIVHRDPTPRFADARDRQRRPAVFVNCNVAAGSTRVRMR